MSEIKEIISHSNRYKGFVILNTPIAFKDLFVNKDIDVVQLHSIQTYDTGNGKDIVGFCGVCEWKNNQLESLDGDSYSENMNVLGYEWFTNEKEGVKTGVDILVGDDW